eukprot:Pgem_evm1s7012
MTNNALPQKVIITNADSNFSNATPTLNPNLTTSPPTLTPKSITTTTTISPSNSKNMMKLVQSTPTKHKKKKATGKKA